MSRHRKTSSLEEKFLKRVVGELRKNRDDLAQLCVPVDAMDMDFAPPDVLILIALPEEFRHIQDLLPSAGNVGTFYRGVGCCEFHVVFPNRTKLSSSIGMRIIVIGDMGEVESALVTQSALIRLRESEVEPKLVVNIGISGATNAAVRLGDVVVADSVHRYFARSKSIDASRVKKKTSKKAPRQLNRAIFFRLAPIAYDTQIDLALFANSFDIRHKTDFDKWQTGGKKDYQILSELFDSKGDQPQASKKTWKELVNQKLLSELPKLHVGPCASGPGIGGSTSLLDLLQSYNRKLLAIDMESGGFLAALRRSRFIGRELVIRGISDYADQRKSEWDEHLGGQVRKLAMRNAFRAFLAMFDRENGLLEIADGPPDHRSHSRSKTF